MAAELQREQSGAKGARRILRKQLEKALTTLQRSRVSDAQVHDARKRIKKARAALRLLRDALGGREYGRENGMLRDVARPLSRIRDSKVLLDTLDKLNDGVEPRRFQGLRRALMHERQELRRQVLDSARPLRSQIVKLRRACSNATHWRLGKGDWSVLGCGLKRVYRQGRCAMLAAEKDGTPESFHEWRKQVKYLRHQLEFMTPMWPGVLEQIAEQAHKLSDDLGDEHDLTVLRDKAQQHGDALSTDLNLLVALIDGRRRDLRDKAVSRGKQLYEEKPRAFAQRVHGYWENWHTH